MKKFILSAFIFVLLLFGSLYFLTLYGPWDSYRWESVETHSYGKSIYKIQYPLWLGESMIILNLKPYVQKERDYLHGLVTHYDTEIRELERNYGKEELQNIGLYDFACDSWPRMIYKKALAEKELALSRIKDLDSVEVKKSFNFCFN